MVAGAAVAGEGEGIGAKPLCIFKKTMKKQNFKAKKNFQ
jgi:hypothetical protein